ncbi:MAG TPA: chorismate-binding protein [Candidatus Corynebacterium avicola]|uniref:Chorismate-binding protein n=1 Tax=Candidatus Corynebacterium avicola TaxID=2838527 RepID=A0A9D1RSQ6_9CORY|nr:chorismate-binding protein [Candidatus Corynebacterium avicola]
MTISDIQFSPDEPAFFSSAGSRWQVHGPAYQVHPTQLGAAADRCFSRHTSAEVVLIAAPFVSDAPDAPAVLVAGVQDETAGVTGSDAAAPSFGQAVAVPQRAVFEDRVAGAVEMLSAEQNSPAEDALRKVVLARRLRLPFETQDISPEQVDSVAADLRRGLDAGNGAGYGYTVPLGHGGMLVGRSPELLLRRSGGEVHSTPLAGSAPRTGDPVEDARTRQRLLSSAKDLREHRYVVSNVVRLLGTVCSEVMDPGGPEVFETETMLHLGTRIRGVLAPGEDGRLPGVFELSELLHPTPAVCGTPTDRSRHVITGVEEPRRYFAGMVGWQDRNGDGETAVTIRCAEITPQAVEVFAGAGIISDSDPSSEADETLNKMRTVLRALGVEPDATVPSSEEHSDDAVPEAAH